LRGSGAERVFVTLANQFTSRTQVDLVLCRAAGPLLEECRPEVNVVDLNVRNEYQSFVPLWRYLRKARPDVLLSTLNLSSLAAIAAVRISGAPTRNIVRIANTLSVEKRSRGKKRVERALVKWFYPRASRLIAVSQGVASDITHYTGIPTERIQIIYNPVISSKLLEQAAEPIDHPWFDNHDLPILLAVGRLEPQKNYLLLIKTFAALQRDIPCRLLILGEGESRPELERLVGALGIADRVDLPGYAPNPFAYMQKADCFVLSSDYEGLPNVLIQAMACGCPVVSTDCPSGPAEILKGGEFGQLVPSGDASALADAIKACLAGDQRKPPKAWLEQFEVNFAAEQYWQVIQNAG
jgi:glycosyltransferase involved in cell wall biosynthesis